MAKTKSTSQNYMQRQASFLKIKMMTRRLIGILACLVAIAGIVIYYFAKTNNEKWICTITIAYCMAYIFSANSFLQDIKVGNPWQRLNLICAIVCYILVAFLIVYGFVSHMLTFQF